jgi:hypothetical protein
MSMHLQLETRASLLNENLKPQHFFSSHVRHRTVPVIAMVVRTLRGYNGRNLSSLSGFGVGAMLPKNFLYQVARLHSYSYIVGR